MRYLSVFLLTWSLLAWGWCDTTSLSDRQRAVHLLDRFAFGPRPGDVERVLRVGFEGWFDSQLRAGRVTDPEPKKPSRRFMVQRKLWRAVNSDAQLQELMTDFWFNHFNVSTNKVDVAEVYQYERDVIRPRALGRFRDLLGAVAHSPAMLDYLDNARSRRATVDKNGNAVPGINENYARELMELHTLGVNGGYTQHDIEELARVLTGWTVERTDAGRVFKFDPKMHDDGPKEVLGVTVDAGGGEDEGERMLDELADHPSTAHFIATKLCRFFISDDPPATAVERTAQAFQRSNGDIKVTLRSVFEAPELWAPASYRSKLKSPLFLVVSAMRTLTARPNGAGEVEDTLGRMGMPLYQCEPPTGYPEREDAWLSASDLLERLNFCTALAENRVKGVSVDLDPLLTYVAGPNRSREAMLQTSHQLIDLLMDAPVSNQTILGLQQAVDDPAIDYPHLIGLILGSPEFQRR